MVDYIFIIEKINYSSILFVIDYEKCNFFFVRKEIS